MPFVDNPRNVYLIKDQDSDNKEDYILQSNATNPRNLMRKGTLKGWQDSIGKLASGNNLLMFSVVAALSPPLLKILDEDGCCFHFSGSSSIGKTTTLHVASSVWGMDKPSSFRTTDNGAESLCKNSNDGLLLMDELAEVDPTSLEKITYLFGNGTGKARAKKNGDAQTITTFRVLGLSTGEIGLQAKLTEKGKSVTAGQSVRFIEIQADSGKGLGVFDTLNGSESARHLADYLRQPPENCGIVIDEFMKYITSDFENVKKLVGNFKAAWLEKCLPPDLNPQVERVAKKFALVAAIGEVTIIGNILPFKEMSISESCKILFDRWLDQRGGKDSHELQDIIERLRVLTQEGANSRFLDADGSDENKNIQKIAGYKKIDGDGQEEPEIKEFWFLPDVFIREVLCNKNKKVFMPQLIKMGYIVPESGGNYTQNKKVRSIGQKRYIVVPASRINS
jgi:putative DNA primase/helicase